MQTQIIKLINDFEHGRMSRRQLIAHLTGMFAATVGATIAFADQQTQLAAPSPADSTATFDATDLNHIALSVSDVQRSEKWYQKHLGLKATGRRRLPHHRQRLAGAVQGRETRSGPLLLQHHELRSRRCGRETQSRRPGAQAPRRSRLLRRSRRHRMPGRGRVITPAAHASGPRLTSSAT